MENFKKISMWTGIVLTGMCGVVLLGAGKVNSGTLLIAMTFLMVRPIKRYTLPRWVKVGLICVVFAVVMWNISTTDLPHASNMEICGGEEARTYTSTGFKFLDQVLYIFSGFLAQASPS